VVNEVATNGCSGGTTNKEIWKTTTRERIVSSTLC